MTKPNSWDRPSLSTDGAPSEDEIFKLVGQALNQWEHLEAQLANLYSVLMNCHILTVHYTFGSILSRSGRDSLILAAGKAYFFNFPEKLTELKSLMSLIGRHVGLRNDIAHSIVQQGYDGDKKTTERFLSCRRITQRRKKATGFRAMAKFTGMARKKSPA